MKQFVTIYDGTMDEEDLAPILASSTSDGLMSKEDKIKLDSLSGGSGSDIESIEASKVTQDETHRFVTDVEKTTWNAQISKSEMGVANGVATLDEAGLVPSAQLPGFIDDVVEVESAVSFPETGESGKLYIAMDENKTYRWTGTQYAEITAGGITLGETSATAYAGDKGKAVTDAVAAIVDGTTVVPKATDASTVNGLTVETAVPADAVFTDTVYEHPETHEAAMIVESAEKKFATEAQLAKVDAIPEDAVFTDTVYEHPETHEAAIIVEDETHKFVTDEQVAAWNGKAEVLPFTPFYDETAKSFYACGVPVVVEASATAGNLIAKWNDRGEKSLEFPEASKVFGGGLGKEMAVHYPSTCVTLNSGKVSSIYGGSDLQGTVGTSTLIINGGTITSGAIVGGRGAVGDINLVGHGELVVNDVDSTLTIYGGPQGLGVVGSTKVTVNNGDIDWLTAGGSNGYTGTADIIINGGTVEVLQSCNRGSMGDIQMTINGGTLQRVYAGGETEDTSVDATYVKSEVFVNGGTIGKISAGTNGGVEDASKVSGTYVPGVITDEVATAMNLTKAPMTFTNVVLEGTTLVFKNGDLTVEAIDLSTINA